MTSMTPMTRTATFRARDGRGAQLAERLLHAASLMAAVPGCELWLVQRDLDDADMIRVTEMWASRQHCDAALNLPGVGKNAAQVMGLLDRPPEVADGEPLGGARMLRGSTGATAFSILDAPDLSKDTQLLERYDLDDVGEARYIREHLDAVQTGLTHYRLRSGRRQGWAHRHGVAEEIYVALSGSGRIKVDEELFELRSLDAIRVAPASARELEAGPNGLEVLAFGSHSPGDGELVADWWTT
jgi:quinol monooxygenase YgiN/mannose-6-phosphate isomerase-like protein (cupin superfamily)